VEMLAGSLGAVSKPARERVWMWSAIGLLGVPGLVDEVLERSRVVKMVRRKGR